MILKQEVVNGMCLARNGNVRIVNLNDIATWLIVANEQRVWLYVNICTTSSLVSLLLYIIIIFDLVFYNNIYYQ